MARSAYVYVLWHNNHNSTSPVAFGTVKREVIAFAKRHFDRSDVILQRFHDCGTVSIVRPDDAKTPSVIPLREWWPA